MMGTVHSDRAVQQAAQIPRGLAALQLLADLASLAILHELATRALRPIELERRLAPGLQRATLHERLGRLMAAGVLARRAFAQAPPRVEYELTPYGRHLCTIRLLAADWEVAAGLQPPPESPSDIAATISMVAPLAKPRSDIHGTCRCSIEPARTGPPATMSMTTARGHLTIVQTDRGPGIGKHAHAIASGKPWQWWTTLTTGSIDRLTIEGDAVLAAHTLAALRLGSDLQRAPEAGVASAG